VLPRGFMSPEQAGIEIPVEFEDDETPFDQQMKTMQIAKQQGGSTPSKGKGQPQQGRPKNSKDSGKRTRTPKPIGAEQDTENFLAAMVWARQAQKRISDIVTPAMLEFYDKKNQRALSNAEVENVENLKFGILTNLSTFSDVTESIVSDLIDNNKVEAPVDARTLYDQLFTHMVQKMKHEPNIEEVRILQASVYSLLNCN
jgi:hypothetical protein